MGIVSSTSNDQGPRDVNGRMHKVPPADDKDRRLWLDDRWEQLNERGTRLKEEKQRLRQEKKELSAMDQHNPDVQHRLSTLQQGMDLLNRNWGVLEEDMRVLRMAYEELQKTVRMKACKHVHYLTRDRNGDVVRRHITLRNQAQYDRFGEDSYLTSREGETVMFLDELVDGETYCTNRTLGAWPDDLEELDRRPVWSVEDEIAACSASYLEKNLDDTNVCHREFRDKSGIHVEGDAIAVGETKAVADEVRWQLRMDAIDDVLARLKKLRLPRDTNKRDFQSLANKTFVPADAGLALPRDNRQVMTLQDRVQKDAVQQPPHKVPPADDKDRRLWLDDRGEQLNERYGRLEEEKQRLREEEKELSAMDQHNPDVQHRLSTLQKGMDLLNHGLGVLEEDKRMLRMAYEKLQETADGAVRTEERAAEGKRVHYLTRDDDGKLVTRHITLRNQAQYDRFGKDSYLTSREGEMVMFLDELVDGETYCTNRTLGAWADYLEDLDQRLVESVEDEIAACSASYLDKDLGDTNVTRVFQKEFRDKSGIHVEVDAMAVGETKAVVAEVRWELGVDAVDDVLAKIDKLRLLGDTGKRDFQFLANKTFVPAVAGLALPRDNRQVKALHDRVQKDGVLVFLPNEGRWELNNSCFLQKRPTLPAVPARHVSSLARMFPTRMGTAVRVAAAAYAAKVAGLWK